MKPRIRTVEYDPGEGWIARSPHDGRQLGGEGFVWRTREVARTVAKESRLLDKPSSVTSTDRASPPDAADRDIETEHFHYDAATRTLTEK